MEKDLMKTSTKQRIIISIITVIMLGSFIASYAAIILANGSSTSSNVNNKLIEKYETAYEEEKDKVVNKSSSNFKEFIKYKSRIKAFNETSANESDLAKKDLKVGKGRKLTEGDTDYLAYYIGWCPNENIFDSTLDSTTKPTKFTGVLDVAAIGLIEGWNQGVVGMKLGGIREITIPSELAYGSAKEICDGYNKPLKFIIMAVEVPESLSLARTKLQYAYSGIDYDSMNQGDTDNNSEEDK